MLDHAFCTPPTRALEVEAENKIQMVIVIVETYVLGIRFMFCGMKGMQNVELTRAVIFCSRSNKTLIKLNLSMKSLISVTESGFRQQVFLSSVFKVTGIDGKWASF